MSSRYDLYIAGTKRSPVSLMFTDEIMLPAVFEAELAPETTYGDLGDLVEIKKAGTSDVEFTGVIEKRTLVDAEDQAIKISGRDQGSVKLSQYSVDREVWSGTEPASILNALITLALGSSGGIKPPTVLFLDDFSGEVHEWPEDSGDWVIRRGTWRKGGGYLECKDSQLGDPPDYNRLSWFRRRNVAAEDTSNYQVSVRLRIISRFDGQSGKDYMMVGLQLYEYADAAYFALFRADWNPLHRRLAICKYSGGSFSELAHVDVDWVFGTDYDLIFKRQGNDLTARCITTGTTVNATDSALTHGRAGVDFGVAKVRYWNFCVRGASTITSSSTASGYDNDYAVDGNVDTAWKPASVPSWIKINLGELKSLARIDVKTDIGLDGRPLKVETSPDNSAWTTRYDNASHKGSHAVITFSSASIRYVKVSQASGTIYEVKEIEVYSSESGSAIIETGTIDNYGTPIAFRADYEPLDEVLLRLARQIAWNIYIDPDGKLNFVAERGTDKSGTISFTRGDNLYGITRELDVSELTWKVKALGLGEGASQKVAVRSDYTVFNLYSTIAKSRTVVDKTFDDETILGEFAQTQLNINSAPRERITAHLDDTYTVGDWRAGDIITLTDSAVNMDGAYRVARIVRSAVGGLDVAEVVAYPASQLKFPQYRDLSDLLVDMINRLKPYEKTPQS